MDGDGTVFTDDILLTDAPNLAAFQSGHLYDSSTVSLRLNANGDTSLFVDAQLVSLTAVPIPASLLLLGSGLAGLFGLTRQKGKRDRGI